MDETLSFAKQLARQTGQLLLSYYNRDGLIADLKSDRSLVTQADLAADRSVAVLLQQTFPNDGVISEELQTISPEDIARVWVIDPLDGTTNFSLGIPFWGVSIALLVRGRPDTAALYFPVLDEMYCAKNGEGAFYNGVQLHLDPSLQKRPGTVFACCSRTHRRYDVSIPYKPRIFGSAAYSFCILARGIALLAFEAAPKIWDIAGAWLVVSEAGGVIRPLYDTVPFPISPLTDYGERSYPILGAITEESYTRAANQILPKRKA
jgi:myo-inositol-1(or 4)-monophosphatase